MSASLELNGVEFPNKYITMVRRLLSMNAIFSMELRMNFNFCIACIMVNNVKKMQAKIGSQSFQILSLTYIQTRMFTEL